MSMYRAHEDTHVYLYMMCVCGDFRPEIRTLGTHPAGSFLSQALGREVAQEPPTGTINLLFSRWAWSKMKLVFPVYTMRRSVSVFPHF